MTLDQLNDKRLLDYRAELEGMISENRLREIKGYSPAYGEKEFSDLSNRYHNILHLGNVKFNDCVCTHRTKELTFGSKLRALRKGIPLTQQKFSERIGIKQPYLAEIEADIKTPSEKVWGDIKKVVGENPPLDQLYIRASEKAP